VQLVSHEQSKAEKCGTPDDPLTSTWN